VSLDGSVVPMGQSMPSTCPEPGPVLGVNGIDAREKCLSNQLGERIPTGTCRRLRTRLLFHTT
jgi:hypothetical protein